MEEYLLVYSLMFSVALIFIQIIMRYVFSNSLGWSEELARYLFLWQIWLGASYAVKERRHLRIEIIQDLMRDKRKKMIFELLPTAIWLLFSIFLTYQGTRLTLILFERGQVSPAMRVPMAYAYASVPVGCALMSIRLICEMVKNIKAIKNEAEA